MTAFIVLIIIALILFTTHFAIRIFDDIKNKVGITTKWERKNLIITIGLLLTLIIMTFGTYLLKQFFDNILMYDDDEQLKIVYEAEGEDENDKALTTRLFG